MSDTPKEGNCFIEVQQDTPCAVGGYCLQTELAATQKALNTIAGGYTNEFPGAPNPESASSPLEFQSAMWMWSQAVARAAIKEQNK